MSHAEDTQPLPPPSATPPAAPEGTGSWAPTRRRFEPSAGAAVRTGGAAPVRPGGVGEAVPTSGQAQRRRRSRWRGVRRWVGAAVVLALLAPPLLGASLVGAIYWQARTDETRPVDAIVVLGTSQWNGRPAPVLRARLDRALEVWADGVSPLIVVTGGKQPGDQFTEAEASRDYLVERGIPERAILLEGEGRDSWQSMRGVAAILDGRGVSRVLLVSDGFHLLRLELMAERLGLDAYSTAADGSPIRLGGPGEFGYVVREAAGIAAFIWHER